MTFVGKVFVVLQLVLTVCFMGWAAAVYTAQTNWRDEAQSLAEQKDRLQGELTKSEASLQDLKTATTKEISELEDNNALLSGKNDTLNDAVARLEGELESARAAVDRQTTLANLAQEQAKFRKEEALRQRARSAGLQQKINELQTTNRSLKNALFEKGTVIARMKERHNAVLADVEAYRKMLLANDASLDPNDYDLEGVSEPPPKVVGRVLGTKTNQSTRTKFIAISLGSDDGFHERDKLIVYRGDDYLGKIQLVTVNTDTSVGQLIPRTAPRDASIQKGDHVRP